MCYINIKYPPNQKVYNISTKRPKVLCVCIYIFGNLLKKTNWDAIEIIVCPRFNIKKIEGKYEISYNPISVFVPNIIKNFLGNLTHSEFIVWMKNN